MEALVLGPGRAELSLRGLHLVSQQVEVLVHRVGVEAPHPTLERLVADGRRCLVARRDPVVAVRHLLSPALVRAASAVCWSAAA